MDSILKRIALAALAVLAALPAWAQQRQSLDDLYRDAWTAEEMIGTEVRGEDNQPVGQVKDVVVDRFGNASHVIVSLGGFYELGARHVAVPWRDVTFGTDLGWLQVPAREVRNGPDAVVDEASWRVRELIGDAARLRDAPRYGYISDVVFDNRGRAQAVVVRRGEGPWGAAGTYAYPFSGYFAREGAYPLPYAGSELARFGPFDYVRLGELSRYSGADRRAAVGSSSAAAR